MVADVNGRCVISVAGGNLETPPCRSATGSETP
jgi:hypothetical protein